MHRQDELEATGSRRVLARPGVVGLALVVLTLIAYWPVRSCGFVALDDPDYVCNNPHVRSGLTFGGLIWAFGTGHAGNWHPLAWLSHMLDTEMFGVNPAGPHLVNLLFHAANALLLFLLLNKMTGAIWRSAFVAALFALHPLHVESVAWIAERKDVLSTFFFMLTIGAYVRHVQKPGVRGLNSDIRNPESERGPNAEVRNPEFEGSPPSPSCTSRSAVWYGLTLLFLVLGLMAKPMLVTLPFVLLLLDYWPLNRVPGYEIRRSTLWPLVREKAALFALAAMSCVVTFLAQEHGGAVQPLTNLGIGPRIENALVGYAWYLGKMFWPAGLAVPYPLPETRSLIQVSGAAALIFSLCGGAVWLRRKIPFVAMGWFWFLGTLVPVIGLIQVGAQSVADRYSYVPLIGVFIALTWGVGVILAGRRAAQVAAGVVAAAILGAAVARTRDQLGCWQNSESLLRHTLALTKDNWLACFALGFDQLEKENTDQAIENLERARQLNPKCSRILKNLGDAFHAKKQFSRAIEYYEAALRLKADDSDTHRELGAALERCGQDAAALKQYTEALALAPEDPLIHLRLGNCLVKAGRNEEAIAHFRQAVQCQPGSSEARNNLGVALFNYGRLDEAVEQFRALVRSQPNHASAQGNLANALALQGKWAEAARHYREAVRLEPDLTDAHYGLARVLAHLGERNEALLQLGETLRLKPDHAGANQMLRSLQAPRPADGR